MQIRKGRINAPAKVLLYGVEGVGKSTWASRWPAPVFLCAESGTEQLDVDRLVEPKAWADALQALDDVAAEDHGYQTLVVDTVDWLEPFVLDAVCQRHRWASIEAPGFGRGYVEALTEWRQFIRRLDAVRQRGLHVVLLGHAHVRRVQPPDSEPYDRFTLKLQDKAAALLREWADAVLFATYETTTARAKDARVARAWSDGARVLRTRYGGAWDAKCRWALADTVPMDAGVVLAAATGTTKSTSLAELLERIGDAAYTDKVLGWLDKQTDKQAAEARAISAAQAKLEGVNAA